MPNVHVVHSPGSTASDALRSLFGHLGWDPANPFRAILEPGQTVLIQPNLVYHRHYRGGELNWIVTEPELVLAVCDYVFLAVGREGRVILGDAPLQSADWTSLMAQTGFDQLPAHYRSHGYHLTVADFRTLATRNMRGVKCSPVPMRGDPNGYHRDERF